MSWLQGLDGDGSSFTAPDAQGGDAATLTITSHGMCEGHHDARSSRAYGMTLRTRTSMNINSVMGEIKLPHREHRYHGKRFVDFPKIDIINLPSGFLKQLLNSADGR
jgi:hypothetical protein